MNKAVVIIQATFNTNGMAMPEYEEYARRSNANGESLGGVVLSKYKVSNDLAGGQTPHFVVIIEYPSLDAATQAFSNAEYQAILPLRAVVFKEVKILVADAQ